MPKFKWDIELEQRVTKVISLEFEAADLVSACDIIFPLFKDKTDSDGDIHRDKLLEMFPDVDLEYDSFDEEFEANTIYPEITGSAEVFPVTEGAE